MNASKFFPFFFIALSISSFAFGQEVNVDMVSFEKYLVSLDSATYYKDKQKIKELEKLYGEKYGRSAVSSRAKKSGDKLDREACAYMAAYYEYDYDINQKIKDLKKAKEFYIKSIDGSDWSKTSQVLYRYAMMVFKYIDSDDIVEVFDFEDREDLVRMLKYEYGKLLWKAADYGSCLANYAMAYVYQMKFFPRADGFDLSYSLIREEVRNRLEFCREYKWLNQSIVEFYSQAAECGDANIMIELAQYLLYPVWREDDVYGLTRLIGREKYCTSDGDISFIDDSLGRDLETQGLYWYEQAAKSGNTTAMIDLAVCMLKRIYYDKRIDHQRVKNLLEQAAEKGNTLAMYNLSVIMMNERKRTNLESDYKPLEDNVQGVVWAKKGAEAGDWRCQHLLGRYYYYGIGTNVDKAEALKWYKKAADNGSMGASYMAGLLYSELEGEDNKKNAVKYYLNATRVKEAQLKLAECYSNGTGVQMNKLKARECHENAQNEDMVLYENFIPEICFIEIKPAQSFEVRLFSFGGLEQDPPAYQIPSCMWKWNEKIIDRDPLL